MTRTPQPLTYCAGRGRLGSTTRRIVAALAGGAEWARDTVGGPFVVPQRGAHSRAAAFGNKLTIQTIKEDLLCLMQFVSTSRPASAGQTVQ